MACIKGLFDKLELALEACHLTSYSGEFQLKIHISKVVKKPLT